MNRAFLKWLPIPVLPPTQNPENIFGCNRDLWVQVKVYARLFRPPSEDASEWGSHSENGQIRMSGVLSREHRRERRVELDARSVERAESRDRKLLNAGRALAPSGRLESTWRAEMHQIGRDDVLSCSEGVGEKRLTSP